MKVLLVYLSVAATFAQNNQLLTTKSVLKRTSYHTDCDIVSFGGTQEEMCWGVNTIMKRFVGTIQLNTDPCQLCITTGIDRYSEKQKTLYLWQPNKFRLTLFPSSTVVISSITNVFLLQNWAVIYMPECISASVFCISENKPASAYRRERVTFV